MEAGVVQLPLNGAVMKDSFSDAVAQGPLRRRRHPLAV